MNICNTFITNYQNAAKRNLMAHDSNGICYSGGKTFYLYEIILIFTNSNIFALIDVCFVYLQQTN